jgi:uracil-DNA glycosylase
MAKSQRLSSQTDIVDCRRCPRLVEYRERVAAEKVKRFRDWEYWGRPVPSFGPVNARLLLVGLAPAAHGGNRTGRVFTGDRSGDWLFRSLHRFGFANQPQSTDRHDGLKLQDCYITAAIHCAPPDNKPLPVEFTNCLPYFLDDLKALNRLKVVVPLGLIGFRTYFKGRAALGWSVPSPLPTFGHGAISTLDDGVTVISSYHPSQQNTQTGKLTEAMLDAVFATARSLMDS